MLPIYFPALNSVPDHVQPGDILSGFASFGVSSKGNRPYSVPVKLPISVLTSKAKQVYDPMFAKVPSASTGVLEATENKAPEEKHKTEEEALSPEAKLEESLRDMQIKYLEGLKDAKEQQRAIEALLKSGLAQWKEHLPLLELQLVNLTKANAQAHLEHITAADQILQLIDQPNLAANLYFPPGTDKKRQALNKKSTALKSTLVTVLKIKCNALLAQVEASENSARTTEGSESKTSGLKTQFNETYILLNDWVKKTSHEIVDLTVAHELMLGHRASALAAITAALEKSPSKALAQKLIDFCKRLGGFHLKLAELQELKLMDEYPTSFRLC